MALKRTPVAGLLLLCLLATLSACGQVAARKASATPTSTPVPLPKGWNAVASPRVGEEGNLQDVAVIAANNAWAVGSYYGVDALQRTLVERWDGATWSVVASPSPSSIANELDAISGDSASDIWAVGQAFTVAASQQFTSAPLIEYWNGTSWTVSPVSGLGAGDHTLSGVAALSPTNVWAVGNTVTQDASGRRLELPLIVHWDGSAWKTVASPAITGSYYSLFNAITAIAANDVWAVGGDEDTGVLPNGENGSGSLIEHWNGSAWSVVQDNATGAPSIDDVGALTSVSADGPNDVWAAGSGVYPYTGGCGAGTGRVMERWDGHSWSYVSFPIPSGAGGQSNFSFNHIAVAGPNDVWAVGGVNLYSRDTTPVAEHWDGSQWSITSLPALATATGFASVAAKAGVVLTVGQTATSNGFGATVVGQWTGSQWARVTSPSPGTLTNELKGVAAIGPKDVWAVGDSAAGTLSEHWNGAQWSVVPTPNGAASDNSLNAVAGTGASDVWAVGSSSGAYYGSGVVEHWDGSSWTVVQSSGAPLLGVVALSKTDAWAVGMSGALHWNGSAWTSSSGAPTTLLGVAAVSANDVWAVGGNPPVSCGGVMPVIIAHWDGTKWSSMPNMPQGILYSVSAASANDVWAVGPGLVMHWDGKQWSQVTLPSALRGQIAFVRSVCAVASDDVWIMGGQSDAQHFAVLHWDGQTWSSAPLKQLGHNDNTLKAVAAVSSGELWAVGSYSQYYGENQALIERYVA